MKPGTKLNSVVCDTQVVIISGGAVVPDCGGVPMAEESPAEQGTHDAAFNEGTLMGKRYVDADGSIEILCVKPGEGSLSLGGVALTTKDAKPLPSSD